MLFFSQKRNKQICGNIFSNGNVKVCQTCSRYWHYLVWYKLSFESRFIWIESVYKCLCFFVFCYSFFVFLFDGYFSLFLCLFCTRTSKEVTRVLSGENKIVDELTFNPILLQFYIFCLCWGYLFTPPPKTMFYSDSPNFQLYTGNNDWGRGWGGILSMI